MKEQDAIKNFGIILPAVAEMMDEQNLSTFEVIAAIWQFIGGEDQPQEVLDAVERLAEIDNELDLRIALGQEALRALGLPHA